ncbi:MAG: 50S ribosomal protein L3 [Candidatus Margulisbacteria bacterium]|jgi:large subunit ribosomal protein L3|nr:50S ribosomal protein L3 [Candidatus Margulisiibacteriota bacterium]
MIGIKKGMTQIFDENGTMHGVTVVETGPCQVTQVKTAEKEGYKAIQLQFGKKKREFRVAKTEDYTVGQEIKVDIFKPGDVVKVTGRSIGKGYQGTVKRFHTHRGPMSHGSKSHRLIGSASSGTTPGRVWPGRKMPGHMGAVQVTQKSLTVVQVIPEKNLLLLRGAVPGKKGNYVLIRR